MVERIEKQVSDVEHQRRLCLLCDEDMEAERSASLVCEMHSACALRNVLGGIGHLLAHEYFCGGPATAGPDAGMDYRTSALLVELYVKRVGLDALPDLAPNNG
jgi:hypothetical protein